MRRFGGLNVSSKVNHQEDRGRSQSPKGLRDWRANPTSQSERDLGRFVSPTAAQDAAILQSVWGDDVKIRQGKALLKPSEIRNRTPGKRRQKDWGECPLTFDVIRDPVRAGDGKVYERWAIEKWLAENGNRSPLTNVVIDPKLVPVADSDEGVVKGERFVTSPKDQASVNTDINTALNAARTQRHTPEASSVVAAVDDEGFTDIPAPPPVLHGASTPDTNSVAVSESGSDQDGNSSARNREIAKILQTPGLTPAQKQSRIQAIRAGSAGATAAFPPPHPNGVAQPGRQGFGRMEEDEGVSARSVSSPSAPKLVWPQPGHASDQPSVNGQHAHRPPRMCKSNSDSVMLDSPGPGLRPGSALAETAQGPPSKNHSSLPPSPKLGLEGLASSGPAAGLEPPARDRDKDKLVRSNTFSEFGVEGGGPEAGAERQALVGIGVTFGQCPAERMHGGALYVKRVQEGGPAAQSGRVLPGDLLFEVDGQSVYRASVQAIQAKILGPPRSQVQVVLKRSRLSRAAGTPGGTPMPDEPLDRLETVPATLARVHPHPAADQQPRELLFDEAQAQTPQRPVRGVFSAQSRAAALRGGPLGQTLEVEARKAAVALFGRESGVWKEMLAEGEGVDLALVCADQRVVRAHRLLMAGSSPLLRRVLQGRGQVTPAISVQSSPGETQVTLTECRAWAVERLVQFLYGGKLRVAGAAELAELWSVSRALEVAALEEAAEDGLLELLTVETCCDLLALADDSGCPRVLDGARRLALDQFPAVARTAGWVGLPEREVEAVLQSERLAAADEEQVLAAALRWMSHPAHHSAGAGGGGGGGVRGERLLGHVRLATLSAGRLQQLQRDPAIARSPRLRGMVEQALAVLRAGASAQPRPALRSTPPTRPSSSPAAPQAAAAPRPVSFVFDPARSHANHLIREAGTLAVLREEGDSEHSALLSPAIPRAGRHFVEFLIDNSGTPECYIQLGVCTGTHDIAHGTPAYQSDTGWCFSCHNGNLLHYDQGSEYCSKLPRQGDRVGLLVDMDRRTLEVFVNSEGQGVMVRNLPETLHFVVDGGDKGQAIRIINATSPVRS